MPWRMNSSLEPLPIVTLGMKFKDRNQFGIGGWVEKTSGRMSGVTPIPDNGGMATLKKKKSSGFLEGI